MGNGDGDGRWVVGGGFDVPEDLEGDGVWFLDGVLGGIALVAHDCGFMLFSYVEGCSYGLLGLIESPVLLGFSLHGTVLWLCY